MWGVVWGNSSLFLPSYSTHITVLGFAAWFARSSLSKVSQTSSQAGICPFAVYGSPDICVFSRLQSLSTTSASLSIACEIYPNLAVFIIGLYVYMSLFEWSFLVMAICLGLHTSDRCSSNSCQKSRFSCTHIQSRTLAIVPLPRNLRCPTCLYRLLMLFMLGFRSVFTHQPASIHNPRSSMLLQRLFWLAPSYSYTRSGEGGVCPRSIDTRHWRLGDDRSIGLQNQHKSRDAPKRW